MPLLLLLGDSTCAEKRKDARPETGWGECFSQYLADGWSIDNRAINGLSTRDCISLGVFQRALSAVSEGDAAIIQFGHNDSKQDKARFSSPWSGYIANLAYMAKRLQEKGVSVYFLTPIARRIFSPDGYVLDTHEDYPSAMKAAAHQQRVPCIDMTIPTMLEIQKMGDEPSKIFFMNFPAGLYPEYPDGSSDNTHLRPEGAEWISALVYKKLSSLIEKPAFIKPCMP